MERFMFVKNKKNKKAVSELLSYVLLVTLALAMAGGVFAYLKFYAQNPLPEEPCDGISVAIIDYSCQDNKMQITITNTGRFTCSAKVKLYNEDGKVIGEGDIPGFEGKILKELELKEPEKTATRFISYSDDVSGDVVKIEVIPFKFDKENHYSKLCPEVKIVQEIIDCEYESS